MSARDPRAPIAEAAALLPRLHALHLGDNNHSRIWKRCDTLARLHWLAFAGLYGVELVPGEVSAMPTAAWDELPDYARVRLVNALGHVLDFLRCVAALHAEAVPA